jgi:hypothetical protein
VNMVRHDDVTQYIQTVPPTHPIKGLLEDASRLRGRQQRRVPIAAERQKMKTARRLGTKESVRDERTVHQTEAIVSDIVPTLSPKSGDKGGAPKR